jgi:hypothetical protein
VHNGSIIVSVKAGGNPSEVRVDTAVFFKLSCSRILRVFGSGHAKMVGVEIFGEKLWREVEGDQVVSWGGSGQVGSRKLEHWIDLPLD